MVIASKDFLFVIHKHLCSLFLFSIITIVIIFIIILAWTVVRLARREVFKNCSITRRSTVAVAVDHPKFRGLFIEGGVASGVGATVVVNNDPGESGGGQQQYDTNSLHL